MNNQAQFCAHFEFDLWTFNSLLWDLGFCRFSDMSLSLTFFFVCVTNFLNLWKWYNLLPHASLKWGESFWVRKFGVLQVRNKCSEACILKRKEEKLCADTDMTTLEIPFTFLYKDKFSHKVKRNFFSFEASYV